MIRGLRGLWLVLLVACASTDSEPALPIEGSFVAASPWSDFPGYYIGFSLNVIEDAVSGQGWLGGTGSPLLPITVVGTFSDPEFVLGISSGPAPWGTITGSVTGNGRLQATYEMTPGEPPVTLTFVVQDSGAVGRYSSNLTGDFTGPISSAAGFGTSPGGFSLTLGYPGRTTPMLVLGRAEGRPDPGLYQVGDDEFLGGDMVLGDGENQRTFRVISGQIRVDISSPYAFIGEVLLIGEEAETQATVGLSAVFSAGCSALACL